MMTIQQRLQKTNLYLVGMMGAGKTTVGRILAKRLGYRFFDTDTLVEQVTGQSISQIFADSGEAGFREVETQVLAELSAYQRLAIATGGGIVLRQQNWSYLHHGIIVWLDAPVDVLYARLKHDLTRPLLRNADPKQTLETILGDRQQFYAQADVRVSMTASDLPGALADRVLHEISHALKSETYPSSTG
jgi:shikimate kinase